MSLLRTVAGLAFAMLVFIGHAAPAEEGLITHEWGTFTSVADHNGAPVEWAPLLGSPDLPCFVNRIGPQNVKLMPGLVRMETPVLYFYSQLPMSLSVHVEFPQGWITEWYPRASRVKPELPWKSQLPASFGEGQIQWDSVRVSPENKPDFLSSEGGSRYFAARNTDSAPLQIGDQQERFIFYRGVGNFAVPLQPRFVNDSKLAIRNAGPVTIPLGIVFENRRGKVGYRLTHAIKDSVEVDPPELTGNLNDLRQQIADSLVEFGLYKKEAAAMLDTWQDSWFEEGMRVFYIVPRTLIDSVLPLEVTPAPATTMRVFVGRVEVLSPWMRQTIQRALSTGDVEMLAKFGRFLNPFMSQLPRKDGSVPSPAATEYLQRAYMRVAREFSSASCVR